MIIGVAGDYNKECKARSSDNISLSLQVVKIEHPCDSALISPRPTDIRVQNAVRANSRGTF